MSPPASETSVPYGTQPSEPIGRATGNRILDGMPVEARAHLMRNAKLLELPVGERLYEPGIPAVSVFFPLTAVCSFLTALSTGERVETATVGNEGLVGLPALLGSVPTSYAMVQIAGDALEVDAEHVRECF